MNQSLFKFSLFSAFFVLTISTAFSQIFDPVKWSFSTERLNDDEATLIFTAKIENKWHLYSTVVETRPEGNPIATSFTIEPQNTKYQKVGKISEPKGTTKYDPNFEMDLKVFDKNAVFKQKIKIITAEAFKIKGVLEFMCCDDSRCLPPTEVPFEFKIDKKTGLNITTGIFTNDTPPAIDTAAVIDTTLTKIKNESIPIATEEGKNNEKSGLLWVFVLGFLLHELYIVQLFEL